MVLGQSSLSNRDKDRSAGILPGTLSTYTYQRENLKNRGLGAENPARPALSRGAPEQLAADTG
jgi:hypothetical protein